MTYRYLKNFIFIIFLFSLSSCDYREEIEIKKGQKGGLYEMSASGKSYNSYVGSEVFKVDTSTFIPLSEFEKVIREKQDDESGFYSLKFKLNAVAAKKFDEMTRKNTGKSICFIINDKVVMAPTVQAPITNGEVDLTVGSQDELEEIISLLKY